MLVASREELGKLVQKIKEKQEKVRDNANLGDTGPRQQAFLQLPWHNTILNWRSFQFTIIVIQGVNKTLYFLCKQTFLFGFVRKIIIFSKGVEIVLLKVPLHQIRLG
jgi:hypothetical protein